MVSIAPMLIGVPVATTPGLVPHADVVVALVVLVDEAVAELVADVLVVGVVVLDVDDDELQAPRTPSETAARTATPTRVRQWTDLFICSAFSLANSEYFFGTGACFAFTADTLAQGARRKKPPFTVVHGYSIHRQTVPLCTAL